MGGGFADPGHQKSHRGKHCDIRPCELWFRFRGCWRSDAIWWPSSPVTAIVAAPIASITAGAIDNNTPADKAFDKGVDVVFDGIDSVVYTIGDAFALCGQPDRSMGIIYDRASCQADGKRGE